jgi:hypothetical protein
MLDRIIERKIALLIPNINQLTISEIKLCIFENRRQETQAENLRSAWRCGQSIDPSLTIEQEFTLHKSSTIDANSSIEELKSILIREIETSLRRQLQTESWMAIGGQA